MKEQRQLETIAITDERWHQITIGMLNDEDKGRELIVENAHYWARAVVLDGDFSVDHLRDGVRWASNLDREAIGKADIVSEADHLEALARRVAHQSLRTGLNLVKSDRRRRIYKAKLLGSISGKIGNEYFGLGRVEGKDLGYDSFVTEL